jgi:chromate transporter
MTVTFKEAFKFWIKLGFINFGGPAGQIAVMHRELVDRRKWVDESVFLRGLNFCMLLPGPEAQQLATYIGWRLHGYLGGVVAGAFFVIPSIFFMLILSWIVAAHGDVPVVAGLFYGISPVVVAIVVEAVMRIGKKSLKHKALYGFAAGAFIAGYFLNVPFPLIVLAAAIGGLVLGAYYPEIFCLRIKGSKECSMENTGKQTAMPPISQAIKVVLVFGILWVAVAAPLFAVVGIDHILSQITIFFTKAAFVTFGGAYAVLSYIADYAVNISGWLTEKQMLSGLGLAESTPGPLIMVTQYVGFLGAWTFSADASQLWTAIAGGLLTTYCTFLPSFMFIFAGAPYIDALSGNRRVEAALTGVTAAVVGVILKLAVFFSVNTFFPGPGVIDGFAIGLAGVTFLALQRFHVPIHLVILFGSLSGMLWKMYI